MLALLDDVLDDVLDGASWRGSVTAARPLLFAFDGSEHARAAIERAGALLQPGPAVVVTVWSALWEAAPTAL